MKNKITFMLCTVLCFLSCSLRENHYICIRVCLDENTTLNNAEIYTEQGLVFYGEFFLIPETDKIIDDVYISSSDENILSIKSIDLINNKFSVFAKNKGLAKIDIKTSNFGSSTTLLINVN